MSVSVSPCGERFGTLFSIGAAVVVTTGRAMGPPQFVKIETKAALYRVFSVLSSRAQ
jgi:hypothetical protein